MDSDHGTEPKQGRELEVEDAALYDISIQLAFDMPDLMRFAAHLLEGSGCKISGDAFFASLAPADHTTVPSKTVALLKYW